MPSLILCGHALNCGSDDFVVTGWSSVVANTLNVAICTIVASSISAEDELLGASFYLAGLLSVVATLLCVCIAILSNRGAFMDPSPRWLVMPLVCIWLIVVALQILILKCTTLALHHSLSLRSHVAPALFIVVVQWLAVFLVLIIATSFIGLHTQARGLVRCLGCLICRRGSDPDMVEVRAHLHTFLGDLPITSSDVATCLVLLQRIQAAARHGRTTPRLSQLHLDGFPWGQADENELQKSRGGALPGTTIITDKSLVEDLLDKLSYATAVYGILMHMLFGQGSLRTARAEQRSSTLSHAAEKRAVLATMSEWPGRERRMLAYLSTRNNVKLTAYAIFVNLDRCELIISLRGTLSISDAMTDVLASPRVLSDPTITGLEEGPHYVHRGMWEAAQNVLADIDKRQVLSLLFSGGAVRERSKGGDDWECKELPDCRGFNLIIVGHSLGAGTGQLLTALLRPRYPNVRFVGYGSPAVMSESLARHMSSCMTQVVCGDDVIPRLSIRNSELFRDRMMALAAHCLQSKYSVITKTLSWRASDPVEDCISPQLVSEESRAMLARMAGKKASPRFFHSGRICYLRDLSLTPGCVGTQAEWADSDHFMEIVVSRKMVAQHFPHLYRRALEQALSSFGALLQVRSPRPAGAGLETRPDPQEPWDLHTMDSTFSRT